MQVQAHKPQAARLLETRVKTTQPSDTNGTGDTPKADNKPQLAESFSYIGQSAQRSFQAHLVLSQSNDQNNPETLLRSQLGTLAQNKEDFHATMQQIYGDNYNADKAEGLRAQTLDGNFDWLPDVRYVDAEVLGGANGAYDAKTQTVLLNADLKGSRSAAETFVEEAGHHLDTLLNNSDTAGDEGEMFRRVLGGEALSQSEVHEIRNEDDTGTIVVDGNQTEVEFRNPFKKIKKAFKKHVQEPFKKHIREPLKEHIEKPLVGLGKDVIAIAKDVGKFALLELPTSLMQGAGNVIRKTFSHGLMGGMKAFNKEMSKILPVIGHQVRDTALMALHGVVNTIEGVLGTMDERKLSTAEIDSLKLVYGDTIDYSEVRIQTGGIKQSTGFSANVVGNDVFMPDKYFDANGVMNEEGRNILIHEIAHVWQYQNRGPEYISQSLSAQSTHGDDDVGSGEGYDWLAAANRGESFEQMNTESQAELAMFIGMAIRDSLSRTGELTFAGLQRELREELKDSTYVLPPGVFAIAQEAHDILRGVPHEPVLPAVP